MTKKRKDTAQCHKGIVLSLLSDSYPFHLKDTFFFSITPFTLSSSSQPSFCNIISFDNSIKQHYLCFSVSVCHLLLNAGDQSSPSCARCVLFLQYNQLLTVLNYHVAIHLESHYYLTYFMLDSGTTLNIDLMAPTLERVINIIFEFEG